MIISKRVLTIEQSSIVPKGAHTNVYRAEQRERKKNERRKKGREGREREKKRKLQQVFLRYLRSEPRRFSEEKEEEIIK